MSWFPDDEPESTEVAPRAMVARRRFVLAAVGGVGVAGLGQAAPDAAPEPGEPIGVDRFAAAAAGLAAALGRRADPNEDAYLHQVAGLAAGLRHPPGLPGWAAGDRQAIVLARHRLLAVVHFRLAPGATIPLHDHRGHNGLVVGLAGTARVRNFEPADPAAVPARAGVPFVVRETRSAVLTPGRTSLLTRTRDNYHELTAGPDGAEFLDVFTYLGPDGRSHRLDLRDRPRPGRPGEYEAAWADDPDPCARSSP